MNLYSLYTDDNTLFPHTDIPGRKRHLVVNMHDAMTVTSELLQVFGQRWAQTIRQANGISLASPPALLSQKMMYQAAAMVT